MGDGQKHDWGLEAHAAVAVFCTKGRRAALVRVCTCAHKKKIQKCLVSESCRKPLQQICIFFFLIFFVASVPSLRVAVSSQLVALPWQRQNTQEGSAFSRQQARGKQQAQTDKFAHFCSYQMLNIDWFSFEEIYHVQQNTFQECSGDAVAWLELKKTKLTSRQN